MQIIKATYNQIVYQIIITWSVLLKKGAGLGE